MSDDGGLGSVRMIADQVEKYLREAALQDEPDGLLAAFFCYELLRQGREADTIIRAGCVTAFLRWRSRQDQDQVRKNERAKTDPHGYKTELVARFTSDLIKSGLRMVGQATILMVSAFTSERTGDDVHDEIVLAATGLAVDRWLEHEDLCRRALAHPKAKA